MTSDLRRHARANWIDFVQTVRFVAVLGTKRREFQTEIGSPLDRKVLADVLGAALDEDTSSRLEDGRVDILTERKEPKRRRKRGLAPRC